MSAAFRLGAGGRVNRGKVINFTFDGKPMQGVEGDVLASALLANGVHLVGRSFKYHRPRGILSAGAEEPNALVGVGADEAHYTPNLRATQIELYEGLVVQSQNRSPSLRFDWAAINDVFWRFIPAGFYYKTFMWPAKAWTKFYEPRIRAMAGLGRAPKAPDAAHYAQRYAHCDVLIVGGGLAGLAAALAVSKSGARVILCDEQAELGGSLLAEPEAQIEGQPAQFWLRDTVAQLQAAGTLTILTRTTAFGYYPHNMLGLVERLTDHLGTEDASRPRERLWQVRAKQVVLATGEIERPLVFPDNDRPGIMLAEAAATYVTRYGVKPGTRAVIVTAHDAAYRAALTLHKAGIEIAAIADLRAQPAGGWVDAARQAGLPVQPATTITGTSGRLRVTGADLAPLQEGGAVGAHKRVACDLLLMSGGFTPSVHLFSQSRGKLVYNEEVGAYLPGASAEDCVVAGACRGVSAPQEVLADGYEKANQVLQALGLPVAPPREFAVTQVHAVAGGFVGAVPHGKNPTAVRAFVDFQNDSTAKDIKLAITEGMRSIEHIKRYTTTGMATDQGKISNNNALGIAQDALHKPIPEIGYTTFRLPYTPTSFGSFAGYARGDLFEPVRLTPIDSWARENGAVYEPVSLWMRARYFPQPGEDMHKAVDRECLAVRQSVGIFDASTLGKIEIVGPDAAEFLNRMYVNSWTKLKPGRLRYGVLLREDGFVMDDGVIGRMSDTCFHVTTTTGGAARVLTLMEDYRQTEFPDLKVWLTSTTEQWAVIALQGPKAREVLSPLVEGADISGAAMPHMSVVECKVAGIPARLFRVSFTGELGFEVNVPAHYGRAIWEALYEAGKPYGITPYGTETMHVLRAEKGYIIVGQETDGTVTPDDAGLSWAIGKGKADFVGKRALDRQSMATGQNRKQLVGLLTEDPQIVLEEGAQLVADPHQPIPMTMIGHVTSSYNSSVLGHSIALALVQNGRARIGETLYVPMPGRTIKVKVTKPIFYDLEGVKLDG